MKQTKHILFTVAMLFCSFAASAHDFEVNGIYYNITSEEDLTVAVTYRGNSYSQYSDEYSGAVTIPSTVIYNDKTYSVTSIGEDAFRYSSLTSITLPEGVTSIGSYAFEGCISLITITIPEGVTSIGSVAFSYCSSLTSITIPESVTSIGEYAFSYCSSLTSIVVAEGNKVYDSRNRCNAIIETTSNTLIQGCSATIIPEDVTSIGGYAFSGCSSLTSITIPESITSIGEYAFSYCSSFTSITIPESVTSIGNSAFSNCSSLTSITIPATVKSIESGTFGGCSSLTTIDLPDGVTSIGERAFSYCSGIKELTLGKQLKKIGSRAFYGCSNLSTVTLLAVEPPFANENTFSNYNIELCVPEEAMGAYKTAAVWRNFTNIIGIDTSIGNPEIGNQKSEMVYDLMGRRVANPTKGGIYIVGGKKTLVK